MESECHTSSARPGEKRGDKLPFDVEQTIVKDLGPCPIAKQGVNDWVNRRVLQLLRSGCIDEIVRQVVTKETGRCGRDVQQDIAHSIETGRPYLELTGGSNLTRVKGLRCYRKRPNILTYTDCGPVDPSLRQKVIATTTWDLHDWQQAENRKLCVSPKEALLELFGSEEELVCVGETQNKFRTVELRSVLRTPLASLQFITPTPMLSRWGKTRQGEPSMHTESNTAQRWHIVTEFDTGTLDEQAAILKHLSERRKLVMVVFSGSKSLHGWFDCYQWGERDNKTFFRYACKLGADPRLWVASQFVRIPGGTNRKTGKSQTIEFFAGYE